MLQEIYKIIKDKSILKSSSFGTRVLDHLFYLLHDIRALSGKKREYVACPDIYFKVGDLCLSVDKIDTFLDFYEARLYCQMVKGGDLAMFRDANEFSDIISFIKTIDARKQNSYWLGVSAERKGDFRFIDGRKIHSGAPFWGVTENEELIIEENRKNSRLLKRKERQMTAERPRNGSLGDRTLLEVPNLQIGPFTGDLFAGADFGVLNKDDFYYVWNVDEATAEQLHTIPLCQFIPERDRNNFQYGEGVWNDWNEYNDLAGWGKNPDNDKERPPSTKFGMGPLFPGYGFFGEGYSFPFRRSDPTNVESESATQGKKRKRPYKRLGGNS